MIYRRDQKEKLNTIGINRPTGKNNNLLKRYQIRTNPPEKPIGIDIKLEQIYCKEQHLTGKNIKYKQIYQKEQQLIKKDIRYKQTQ